MLIFCVVVLVFCVVFFFWKNTCVVVLLCSGLSEASDTLLSTHILGSPPLVSRREITGGIDIGIFLVRIVFQHMVFLLISEIQGGEIEGGGTPGIWVDIFVVFFELSLLHGAAGYWSGAPRASPSPVQQFKLIKSFFGYKSAITRVDSTFLLVYQNL